MPLEATFVTIASAAAAILVLLLALLAYIYRDSYLARRDPDATDLSVSTNILFGPRPTHQHSA